MWPKLLFSCFLVCYLQAIPLCHASGSATKRSFARYEKETVVLQPTSIGLLLEKGLITSEQMKTFLEHVKKFGPVYTFDDLIVLPSWDEKTIQRIAPYVRFLEDVRDERPAKKKNTKKKNAPSGTITFVPGRESKKKNNLGDSCKLDMQYIFQKKACTKSVSWVIKGMENL